MDEQPRTCEFKMGGVPCLRTDFELVEMYDGGVVRICREHRSWTPAMGRIIIREDRSETWDTPGLNRDWLADVIDGYMGEGGEFRAYDLADRIIRKALDNPEASRA